jgi:hypothetical protein
MSAVGASGLWGRFSTNIDNSAAQTLYEQQGWARDRQFLVYNAPTQS